MGTISQKLEYTKNSIDDIEKALSEKGYNMTLYILGDYASLIRKLSIGGGEQNFPSITERECNYIIYCFNIPDNSVKMTIISPADFVNVKDNIVDCLLVNKIPKLTLVKGDIIGNIVTIRKSLILTYIFDNEKIYNTALKNAPISSTCINNDIININIIDITQKFDEIDITCINNDIINNTQKFDEIDISTIYVNEINETTNLNDDIVNTHITQIEMEDN